MPTFTAAQVLKATGGVLLSGEAGDTFYGITTDSRKVEDRNLFVALQGEQYDGHDFAALAVERGAAGLLVHNETKIKTIKPENKIAVIKVADTLQALGDLAHNYRKRFSIPVIGLTGSSGKTTTKEMIAAIAGRGKTILATEGNLNNLIGLPQTIFRLTKDHELAILEMGTNIRGEIERLTQIAAPDIGLITNIGPAHLAGFGSVDVVREEKGDLFFNMAPAGTAVVNLDDEAVRIISERWTGRRITFGMSLDADITAKDIEKNGARGVRFNLVIGDKASKVEMKIVGIHHIYNALAAAAAAWAAGVDCKTIAEGLASFEPVSGRMQIIKLQNCAFVLDDSYNANPASVREALMTLKDLKNHHNGYVFLGDMLELGAAASEMHRKIGTLMATVGVNAVFLKGDFSRVTAAGATEGGMLPEKIFFLSQDEDGMPFLKKNLKKGDWVLVKGSRRMKMEKIVTQICDLFGRDKNGAKNDTIARLPGVNEK
ncbi:MAG: UDP-N-acetylmuramoyl-tripeptide--D-alanyl-D-alanine ligase [Smithellaceae bacterium]